MRLKRIAVSDEMPDIARRFRMVVELAASRKNVLVACRYTVLGEKAMFIEGAEYSRAKDIHDVFGG